MYPVLLSLELSNWQIPLLPWLSLLTVGVAAIAIVSWQRDRADTAIPAGVAAVVVATAAVLLKDHAYTVTRFQITSFGGMLSVALVLGVGLTARAASRAGQEREVVLGALIVSVLAGFVGARLAYVAAHWGEFDGLGAMLDVRGGGLLGYPGLVVGVVTLILYSRWCGRDWERLADAAAVSIALGAFLTRLGEYGLGSGFGLPLSDRAPHWVLALGSFPRWPLDVLGGAGSPAWSEQVVRGVIPVEASVAAPVHPTQLYAALGLGGLAGGVAVVKRTSRFPGETFLALGFGYGALRFVVDLWLDNADRWLVSSPIPIAWALAGGLGVVGASFALGPACVMQNTTRRRVVQGLALGAAIPGYLLAQRSQLLVSLSVSQGLGLVTVVLAGAFWGYWAHRSNH